MSPRQNLQLRIIGFVLTTLCATGALVAAGLNEDVPASPVSAPNGSAASVGGASTR